MTTPLRTSPLLLLLALGACATLGTQSNGDQNTPTAGVGPFRLLGATEMQGEPPYVLDDKPRSFREPAVLPLGGSDMNVALYLVSQEMVGQERHGAIVRTRADDARSFYGALLDTGHHPPVVLSADQPWEGADLSGPSALTVGGEVRLYYVGAGGVGLARSPDGLAFTKVAGPVLPNDALGPIGGPSVARMPDGAFRMLFTQGDSIYEAASPDGVAWTRLDADPSTPAMDPVLGPAPPRTDLTPGEKPPFDTLRVADPCLVPRVTPAGRLHFRVLYTGYAVPQDGGAPASAIGFAARYGESGTLSRQPLAVYSQNLHEAGPALFEWSGGSLLYVHQDRKGDTGYTAVAVGFAPATLTLPAPSDFAQGP